MNGMVVFRWPCLVHIWFWPHLLALLRFPPHRSHDASRKQASTPCGEVLLRILVCRQLAVFQACGCPASRPEPISSFQVCMFDFEPNIVKIVFVAEPCVHLEASSNFCAARPSEQGLIPPIPRDCPFPEVAAQTRRPVAEHPEPTNCNSRCPTGPASPEFLNLTKLSRLRLN